MISLKHEIINPHDRTYAYLALKSLKKDGAYHLFYSGAGNTPFHLFYSVLEKLSVVGDSTIITDRGIKMVSGLIAKDFNTINRKRRFDNEKSKI